MSKDHVLVRGANEYNSSVSNKDNGVWKLAPIDFACSPYILDVALVFHSNLSVEILKSTLSELLALYPTLAGRADQNDSVVSLSNVGVPFLVVNHRECDVGRDRHKSGGGGVHSSSLRPDDPPGVWTPFEAMKETGSMMSVQVNYLGEGCVLGVCVSHRCMDGNSFYTFLKNWAALCRSLPLPSPPLLDQRLAPNANRHRQKEVVIREAEQVGWVQASPDSASHWSEAMRTGRHTRRFGPIRFSAVVLARIKQLASGNGDGSGEGAAFITTNEALCAHLAQASATVLGWEHGYPLRVAALVDLRERLPCIPANFVGNAIGWATASIPVGTSLSNAAATIHKAWQPYTIRPSPTLTQQTHLHAENLVHSTGLAAVDFDNLVLEKPNTIYTNSFAKFSVYEDFGCGLPSLVIPQHTSDSVLLFPAPPPAEAEGDGVLGGGGVGGVDVYFQGGLAEAWLSLPDEHEAWSMLLGSHDHLRESTMNLLQQRATNCWYIQSRS